MKLISKIRDFIEKKRTPNEDLKELIIMEKMEENMKINEDMPVPSDYRERKKKLKSFFERYSNIEKKKHIPMKINMNKAQRKNIYEEITKEFNKRKQNKKSPQELEQVILDAVKESNQETHNEVKKLGDLVG